VSLKKIGRYDLVRVLGKGAMGIVYEARDPNLDRRVAIKTVKVENLSEEAAAEYEHRFRTEARSAARLQHPNIVSVYDSDRDGDVAFLVMEYIHGDDLKHHLDKGMRYSLEQSLKMIRDLLSALEYAHKQGIIHRDIKPANLLIEPGGRLKLTDFGVARIQDSGEATRTQGSMVGTLKYMAPEQVQGQKIDSRADLFSVGVVLYQLLTDKRPFDGDNDFSIIHQVIGHEPPPPSAFNAGLPAAIDAVVARALAKDREQRFASARDFAAALQSATRRAEDQTVVPPADPARTVGTAANGSRTGQSLSGAATSPSSTVTQELELVYWKDIKDSADREDLEAFLAKFPAGIYADLARRRLRKLEGPGGPDQTVLSGLVGAARADEDLEATRMPTRTTPQVVAARASEPASLLEHEADSPHDQAPTQPLVHAKAAAQQGGRSVNKKPPLAIIAAVGAVVVVAAAAFAIMGRGGMPASDASAQVPAAPVTAASAPPVALAAASAPVVAASSEARPPATITTVSAPAMGASSVKVAMPRKAASAVRPKADASMGIAGTSRTVAVAPSALEATPVGGSSAVEACRDKMFLTREFCLSDACEKPGARNHPMCVRWHEEKRLREDGKVRQGPQ